MRSNPSEPDIDFFKLVGDQAEKVFFVYDFSVHHFCYLNHAFHAVWKKSAEDFSNPVSLLATIHPEDRQYVAENYQQFVAQREKINFDFRILWPDTTDRWISLWVYPIMQGGEMRFAAGIAEDDSQRKKNFFHMQEISAKKDSTMEILSHDLKGPLGIIQSFASLIQKRLYPSHQDQEIFEWLKIIQQTCQRSSELIRNFVNQEFLESANVEVNKERLDMVWEIGQVIETTRSLRKILPKCLN